jgi:divalent metal cation (Fe/Co/Zn/Cd) transporter
VLVDACKCGDIVDAIGDIARTVKGIKEVHSIRIRQLGPYLTGDMHIVVGNDMLVKEADEIATNVEQKIKEEFGRVIDIKVRIESDEAHNRHSRDFDIKVDEPNSNSVKKS